MSHFSQDLAETIEAPPAFAEATAGKPPPEIPTAPAATPVYSDEQMAEASKRYTTLQAYWALVQAEPALSIERAARRLGVDNIWLWRRIKDWKTKGESFDALIPAYHKSGRKSTLVKISEGIGADAMRSAIDQVRGLHLDTESNTSAWRLFAHSDRCPEALADVILDPTRTSKHSLPGSLRAATRLPEPVRNAHRGPRRLALKGMWTPRVVDVLPGDIFTSDDTTPIWAWWVPWEKSKAYPYGVKLMQGQLLPVIDVASQCPVSFVLIAREASSYRATDIWQLFGHTFETVGLPRLGWQLERGNWEANAIAGVELEYREGEQTMVRRVGGLRQLPTNLTDWHRARLGERVEEFPRGLRTWTSFLPKSKSIEAFFHRSQILEGTIWGSLGRDQMRKPYEKTKKIYEAGRRGASDPTLHFLSQIEMVKRIRGIMEYIAWEPMEGEVFHGIPRQKFDAAREQYPLLTLPEDQRWLYRRDWKPVIITNGWARVRLTHDLTGQRYSLFYQNAEHFAGLEGEQVIVYYDREKFEQPAQIVLARTGQYLCEAQYEERCGSFLPDDDNTTGHEVRSAWKNAVMSAYATVVPFAPSRQVPPEISARRAAAAAQPDRGTDAATVIAHIPAPTAPRRGNIPAAPTLEQFSRRQARLAEEAEAARAQANAIG